MPQRLAILLALAISVTNDVSAQTTGSREPTLRERLVAGLNVRRPSEFEFIDAVVDTVDRGELPPKLVDRMFFWARTRPSKGSQQRPIVYFQPGLTRVAQKLGVDIESDETDSAGNSSLSDL
jgi:hypothetical protein